MVRQPHRRTQKHSHEPPDIGVPTYRTYVQYIPQRPSLLPGTPRDLIETLSTFHARFAPERASGGHDHFESSMVLAEQWGIAKELWDRPWSLVSVGESQRLSLAIAYGFNRAEVLMLDGACFTITMPSPLIYIRFTRNYQEPTSGLDPALSTVVEDTLMQEIHNPDTALKAIIWITHSDEQAERVGTRFLHLTPKGIEEENRIQL